MIGRDGDPIRCLVPFCRGRSWKHKDSVEYLCSRHYQRVDRAWRTYYRHLQKRVETCRLGGWPATLTEKRLEDVWAKHIKPQALARAMGSYQPEDEEKPESTPVDRYVRAPRHAPDF